VFVATNHPPLVPHNMGHQGWLIVFPGSTKRSVKLYQPSNRPSRLPTPSIAACRTLVTVHICDPPASCAPTYTEYPKRSFATNNSTGIPIPVLRPIPHAIPFLAVSYPRLFKKNTRYQWKSRPGNWGFNQVNLVLVWKFPSRSLKESHGAQACTVNCRR